MSEATRHAVIISGPGGVGKGTIVSSLMERHAEDQILFFSRSWTTRPIRPGEVDGVHYDFVSEEKFLEHAGRKGFLEWARFGDYYYGTPASAIVSNNRPIVILEIDCQGFKQVRDNKTLFEEVSLTTIFIAPPSWETLEERLSGREGESDSHIAQRLELGRKEMEMSSDYDHVVVNDDLNSTVNKVDKILLDLLSN